MKKSVIMTLLIFLTLINVLNADEKQDKIKTTILPGTIMSGVLITSALVPIEGSASGTRPMTIKIKGYALGPNGKKIYMDGVLITGWASGDQTGQRVDIYCTGISYYDYMNIPHYDKITANVLYKGIGGVPGTVEVNKQYEYIMAAFFTSAMDALGKAIGQYGVPFFGLNNTNFTGTVVNETATSSFSTITTFLMKTASQYLPEILVENGKLVEVNVIDPFDYYTREFVTDENK